MKKYILLVDDDTDELMIFLEALNKLPGDFKCTYACNSEQAIQLLKVVTPDYIFVDYHLPKLNGLQFLSAIKSDELLQRVSKFLYSNSITDEIREMALLAGAVGCIEKTGTINRLVLELKSVLSPNVDTFVD